MYLSLGIYRSWDSIHLVKAEQGMSLCFIIHDHCIYQEEEEKNQVKIEIKYRLIFSCSYIIQGKSILIVLIILLFKTIRLPFMPSHEMQNRKTQRRFTLKQYPHARLFYSCISMIYLYKDKTVLMNPTFEWSLTRGKSLEQNLLYTIADKLNLQGRMHEVA